MSSPNSLAGKHVNVAMLTSGGLAPCLGASIAQLVHYWVQALKEDRIAGLTFRMYRGGYKGVLLGDSFLLPESEWTQCDALNHLGGSPIGNSRVKVRCISVERKDARKIRWCTKSFIIHLVSPLLTLFLVAFDNIYLPNTLS